MDVSVLRLRNDSLLCFALAFCFSSVALAGCMDTENKFWLPSQANIYSQLMEIMSCPLDANSAEGYQIDAVGCNYFVAKSLSKIYSVDDFAPQGPNKRWLTANEIAGAVQDSDKWSLLGDANDQDTLKDAAQGASNGQAVVAVLRAPASSHGHVALILPGALVQSSWKNPDGKSLKVPNSASFFLNKVDKAYIFCRLSNAFDDSTKNDVKIYWRVKEQ